MIRIRRFFRAVSLLAFHVLFVRPFVVWFLAGVRYRRRNQVPKGPCLVVSNHNSHVDAAVLMSMFPLRRLRHVHPVAAADYFGKNRFRKMMAMLLMNAIPIDRTAAAGQDPLAGVVQALADGESLIFFPEGSRGEAGVVATFRPGVGRIVRSLPGVPVVPVFLSGPERFWPRGSVVPMPLGIDANIGRPRSYSASLDAREIAQQVRRDVLALAPPPAPVPGPRPSRPFRVGICAIERDVRRSVFLELTERLGRIDRTVGIAEPVLESDARGAREATGGIPLVRSGAWPALLASAFRVGGRLKGSKFAEMVRRARIDEALDHGRSARFVVGDGNALVDLMAWAEADFYSGIFDERGMHHLMLYLSGERRIRPGLWWQFVRKAPEVWLLNVFDLARPPAPDLLVLVTVPPSLAMERIRSRGEPLEPHDNEKFLESLQEAYRQVAGVLERRRKVEVLELDGGSLAPAEIVDRIEQASRRLRMQRAAP